MEKIRGIVLRTIKYGDNGYIVDMFTDSFGRMSFMMKRSGGKKKVVSGISSNLLPLSLLEFECEVRPQQKLPLPKDIRNYHPFHSLHWNPMKSTLAFFIAEFLVNALKEENENRILFDYLEGSLLWLDNADKGISNFHLAFLMHMTRFLGIYPNVNPQDAILSKTSKSLFFFDMVQSEYRFGQPNHNNFLRPEEARAIPYLLNMRYENMHVYRLSGNQRRRCLEVLNEYYRIHLPNFGELKSIEVLHEVFN